MTPVMPTVTNPTEALLLEQAHAMIRDLVATGDGAADGQVLHQLEGFLLTRGREFLRQALATTAQAQAAAVEKKRARRGSAPAATGATAKGPRAGTS